MIRIAIVGGGISGLAAAYELELARQQNPDIDWHLYEATDRLGGIVETTHHDGFTLEGGPDAWVSEKSAARDLAIELGLKNDLIASNDATRKTYILRNGTLEPIPGRMRMMVPEDLAALDNSSLFSDTARTAYADEIANAAKLRAEAADPEAPNPEAPNTDESVATFVLRHFGEEVLTTLAAPLLSGIFGGDVHKLSARAVMPAFVAMEREHGSLILALQAKSKAHGSKPKQAIFTTLRRGMGSLTAALIARLPADRLHLNRSALSLKREGKLWLLRTTAYSATDPKRTSKKHFRHVLLATPVDATRDLLQPLAPEAASLLPTDASSAVLAAFTWPAHTALPVPEGFGFLVPQQQSVISTEAQRSGETCLSIPSDNQLMACTFVDQKFPHRAPEHARILRAFFGGAAASTLQTQTDEAIAQTALQQLTAILGPLPTPSHTEVRRWPRSLPQYEVGHLDRMTQLDESLTHLPNLHLLGNSYRGVGLPDLIHHARETAQTITNALFTTH